MKKPMFVMLSLLFVLCIIYNYTNMDKVEASEPYSNIQEVVDFEPPEGTTETSTEGSGNTKTSSTSQSSSKSSSQDSAKDFVNSEGQSSSTGEQGSTTEGKNIFNNQSGDEAAEQIMKQSEPDILGDDYQFGDDILQTDETPESFFQHIYKKTWQAFSGIQKVLTVIVMICFITAALMTLISAFGRKEKVMWYALTMLLSLIILICIIYAPQIAAAFTDWFVTPA